MTGHRFAEHAFQLVHRLGLSKDRISQGVRFITAFRRFLDGKNYFGLSHCRFLWGHYMSESKNAFEMLVSGHRLSAVPQQAGVNGLRPLGFPLGLYLISRGELLVG
jgi:hypothetical protein